MKTPGRREFIQTATLAATGTSLCSCSREKAPPQPGPFKGIVDVHQHVGYPIASTNN